MLKLECNPVSLLIIPHAVPLNSGAPPRYPHLPDLIYKNKNEIPYVLLFLR